MFLNDAPPPKLFWARRQTHENTIHMVDALSAAAGSVPSAADAGIDSDVALDGIDELLCGFFTRGKSKLFDGTEFDVLVAPTDSDRRWRLHVAERMTVDDDGRGDVDVTHHGRRRCDLPCTLESRRRDRSRRRRHAARALAAQLSAWAGVERAQIAAQLPTTVRGSAHAGQHAVGLDDDRVGVPEGAVEGRRPFDGVSASHQIYEPVLRCVTLDLDDPSRRTVHVSNPVDGPRNAHRPALIERSGLWPCRNRRAASWSRICGWASPPIVPNTATSSLPRDASAGDSVCGGRRPGPNSAGWPA